MLNIFLNKTIQHVVAFVCWHFDSFLLSIVVTTVGVGVASITVVAKAVVAVIRISGRLGGWGSFSRPLAIDNSAIGIGVASVPVMAKAIVAIVGLGLGSR